MRKRTETRLVDRMHSWSELTALIPGTLQASVDVRWRAPRALAARARNESFDVLVPPAHNAALTTSYFRGATRALGEALAAQLDGRRAPNALNAAIRPRQIQPEHRTGAAASSTRALSAPGGIGD
jgi:hypothetical protein